MCWGQGGPGAKCDENEYKWIKAQTGMQLVPTQILSKVKKQTLYFWFFKNIFWIFFIFFILFDILEVWEILEILEILKNMKNLIFFENPENFG